MSPDFLLRVTKRPYYVQCHRPPLGTKVHNYLEDSDYVTDENQPFVITGTRGEQWPISKEKLLKGYTLNEMDIQARIHEVPYIIYARVGNPEPVWAALMPIQGGQFEVPTSWGTVLTGNRPGIEHGWGDVIIAADDHGKPSESDRWIVNGRVFFDTYQVMED